MQPTTKRETTIRPQPGPQERYLACPADIVVYGGGAGGGKTWAILLDALRFAAIQPVTDFGAVIFRRTSPQITAQGGMWDASFQIYPLVGGKPNLTRLEWNWPQLHTRIRFSHMQYESDRFDWQGSEIPFIGFDELTHFEESQFFFLLSRNRSTCGVKPRIRATTNPDPDSWVKRFLAPWVDDTFPQPADSGEIRRFIRDNGQMRWMAKGESHPDSKSVTFIAASVYDNRKLLEVNPEYLANLKALPLIDRMRMLEGDWNIRAEGNLFKRHWFKLIPTPPAELNDCVRFWDCAATEATGKNDPDYTAGVKIGVRQGKYVVLDAIFLRESPAVVEKTIKQTAMLDGLSVKIRMEQEPGSAGKKVIQDYAKALDGFDFRGIPSTGSKVLRAGALSAQAEVGNVEIVQGWWNDFYLNTLCAFPSPDVHDDLVDASSGAHSCLSSGSQEFAFASTHMNSALSWIPAIPHTAPPTEEAATPEASFQVLHPEDADPDEARHSQEAALARTLRALLDNRFR